MSPQPVQYRLHVEWEGRDKGARWLRLRDGELEYLEFRIERSNLPEPDFIFDDVDLELTISEAPFGVGGSKARPWPTYERLRVGEEGRITTNGEPFRWCLEAHPFRATKLNFAFTAAPSGVEKRQIASASIEVVPHQQFFWASLSIVLAFFAVAIWWHDLPPFKGWLADLFPEFSVPFVGTAVSFALPLVMSWGLVDRSRPRYYNFVHWSLPIALMVVLFGWLAPEALLIRVYNATPRPRTLPGGHEVPAGHYQTFWRWEEAVLMPLRIISKGDDAVFVCGEDSTCRPHAQEEVRRDWCKTGIAFLNCRSIRWILADRLKKTTDIHGDGSLKREDASCEPTAVTLEASRRELMALAEMGGRAANEAELDDAITFEIRSPSRKGDDSTLTPIVKEIRNALILSIRFPPEVEPDLSLTVEATDPKSFLRKTIIKGTSGATLTTEVPIAGDATEVAISIQGAARAAGLLRCFPKHVSTATISVHGATWVDPPLQSLTAGLDGRTWSIWQAPADGSPLGHGRASATRRELGRFESVSPTIMHRPVVEPICLRRCFPPTFNYTGSVRCAAKERSRLRYGFHRGPLVADCRSSSRRRTP